MKKGLTKRTGQLLAVLCLIVGLMVILSGCGSKETATASSEKETVSNEKPAFVGSEDQVYYMVTFVSGVDYWTGVYEGFKDAAKQLGVKAAYTGTPEYDVNKQVTVFNQVVAKKPAGIAVAPINSEAFIEPIKQALAQGIKVVTFASDSPDSGRLAYITSDNYKEGYYAADAIAEAIGGSGEVAILENPGQDNHERRVNAFIERIKTKWPNVKVVARAATYQDPNKAATGLKTMVQANPNIKGVFAPEASSGMGAAQAAIELGTGIKVMNVDINDAVLDMIKEGKMFGAIQPNTVAQGYWSMLSLYVAKNQLLNPMNDWKESGYDPVNIPFLDNGLNVVTQKNAQYFYSKPFLEKKGSKGLDE